MQDYINEDIITNKLILNIHMFGNNSWQANHAIKLSTINNFT